MSTDAFTEYREKIDAAHDAIDDAEVAVIDAENAVRNLRMAIGNGDSDAGPRELLEAVAAVEVARLRHRGAVAIHYDLKRNAPFDPIVAKRAAEALSEALPFPVKSVEKVPSKPAKIDAPTLYVSQDKGATAGRTAPGSDPALEARLTFTLHEPVWSRIDISPDALNRALLDAHASKPEVQDQARKAANLAAQKARDEAWGRGGSLSPQREHDLREGAHKGVISNPPVHIENGGRVVARVESVRPEHLDVTPGKDEAPQDTVLVFDTDGDVDSLLAAASPHLRRISTH